MIDTNTTQSEELDLALADVSALARLLSAADPDALEPEAVRDAGYLIERRVYEVRALVRATQAE